MRRNVRLAAQRAACGGVRHAARQRVARRRYARRTSRRAARVVKRKQADDARVDAHRRQKEHHRKERPHGAKPRDDGRVHVPRARQGRHGGGAASAKQKQRSRAVRGAARLGAARSWRVQALLTLGGLETLGRRGARSAARRALPPKCRSGGLMLRQRCNCFPRLRACARRSARTAARVAVPRAAAPCTCGAPLLQSRLSPSRQAWISGTRRRRPRTLAPRRRAPCACPACACCSAAANSACHGREPEGACVLRRPPSQDIFAQRNAHAQHGAAGAACGGALARTRWQREALAGGPAAGAAFPSPRRGAQERRGARSSDEVRALVAIRAPSPRVRRVCDASA